MDNRWKEIWSNKGINFSVSDYLGGETDEFTVYSALKKLDGYDVSIDDPEKYYR